MKNYEKQKRQQYETHKKLNRRGKKVLGMLAASLMIGGYAYSSNDASTHNIKYDSRFKMQSNEGLVGTGMDLNRLEKISSNGGTILLLLQQKKKSNYTFLEMYTVTVTKLLQKIVI